MPRPIPVNIRHEVLVPVCEGMHQCAIAGRMGLTCANVNRILWGHHSADSSNELSDRHTTQTQASEVR